MCVEIWYPCKLKCGSSFNIFHKKVAECYDTMGLFVDSDNKMAKARQELEQAQHQKTLPPPSTSSKSKNTTVTVSNALLISDKLRIKKNMSTLVNVLSGYIARQEGVIT